MTHEPGSDDPKRVDALREARKQAKYIEAASNNASVDPAVLRLLQRKYKPFAPRPIKEPTVFYGVRLGHVPGVYTSLKEAKPHTVGILSDYKRFKTRKKAEEYVAQVTTLGQPLLPSPLMSFYTLMVRLPSPLGRQVGECLLTAPTPLRPRCGARHY